MTQIILNVEDANLVPFLKQLLGFIKGVTICDPVDKDAEAEKQFVTETIVQGYRQAQEGHFVGKNLSSLDDLVAELREEIK